MSEKASVPAVTKKLDHTVIGSKKSEKHTDSKTSHSDKSPSDKHTNINSPNERTVIKENTNYKIANDGDSVDDDNSAGMFIITLILGRYLLS